MARQKTPVKVYLAVIWTIGFLMIFLTTERKPTDASQLLTEDQKQELLPRLNKLNQIASDFARQQEVTTEYTVKKREVLEHLIEQKVKDSVLSNSNFRVRAEEAVDTSLSNMKPNLKLLEEQLLKLIDHTVSLLSPSEDKVLELIKENVYHLCTHLLTLKGPDSIRNAVEKAITEHKVVVDANSVKLLQELAVPDPAVITPEILSMIVSKFTQREIMNPQHMQFKAVQRWKAQVASAILEKINNFDWKGLPTILKTTEAYTNQLLDNSATRGTVQKVVTSAAEANNFADQESRLAQMKEKQEAQAVDIQTLQERGEAQEKTGTGLEEKVQSWKNDAENVHQDLKSLIALRERAYLTDVLKQASKAEINTIFAQQAESNEKSIKGMAEQALDKFSADQLGLVDFASFPAGGRVYSASSDIPLSRESLELLFDDPSLIPTESIAARVQAKIRNFLRGLPSDYDEHLLKLVTTTQKVISLSNQPGECWPFPGDKGNITIALSKPIVVTNVSLEQLAGRTAVKPRLSAPKDFEVYGLNVINDKTGNFSEPVLLFSGALELDPLEKSSAIIRTFTVPPTEPPQTFSHVRLRVLSNYGASYTCLYRFRVHSV